MISMPKYIQGSQAIVVNQPKHRSLTSTQSQIGFVLDCSGSMSNLQTDAITGFNTLVEEQRKASPESKLNLALFSNSVQFIYNALPLSEIPPLTPALYNPCGGTALNDGIGE